MEEAVYKAGTAREIAGVVIARGPLEEEGE